MKTGLNMFLADIEDNFSYSNAITGFFKTQTDHVLNTYNTNTGNKVTKALFIPYGYSTANHAEFMNKAQALFNVKLELIRPGYEAEDVDNAEMVVIGGGDIKKILDGCKNFAPNLRSSALKGVPFVGWNASAEAMCMATLDPTGTSSSTFGIVPFQFINNYNDSQASRTKIENFLKNHLQIAKTAALVITDTLVGGGIRLEDSGSALAGTDSSGGTGPVTVKGLYIFTLNGDQIVELQYNKDDLKLIS